MNEDFRRHLAKSGRGDVSAAKSKASTFEMFPDDVFSNISGSKGIDEFAASFNQLAIRMNSLPGIL